jgi:hypothetical protein
VTSLAHGVVKCNPSTVVPALPTNSTRYPPALQLVVEAVEQLSAAWADVTLIDTAIATSAFTHNEDRA